MSDHDDSSLDLHTLGARLAAGRLSPAALVEEIIARNRPWDDAGIWIARVGDDALRARAAALESAPPAPGGPPQPLYGIPFAVKDNIDVAGMPTTAACPDFAYTPAVSATVVRRLEAAGAILIGKTNLDQFATGLVGTRTPYGICTNPFDRERIPGGSSAGSAVAVARGLVSFALGTDTAGSGRVPAAFNNLVGLKPTRGLLSTAGVVPACRSLDCVSVFALTAADAAAVLAVAAAPDPEDPYSRPTPAAGAGPLPAAFRFGVPRPEDLAFFGDAHYPGLFEDAVARVRRLGGEPVAVDLGPFLEAARLLYEGPWVAERYAAIADFIARSPGSLLDVTRAIIEPAGTRSAVEAFAGQYRLRALAREAAGAIAGLDFVLTPTAGTHYRIDEVLAEPLALNANLGRYTNFMNLLDYAAVAVPAGFTPAGLPFGVTLFAPAFSDRRLLAWAALLEHDQGLPLGATGRPGPPTAQPERSPAAPPGAGTLPLVVCGAHMEGLALNAQLTERGARLRQRTTTAPSYRLYALAGGPPRRPGLVRVPGTDGAAIPVEVWDLPAAAVGSFLELVPAPLVIGRVELADGTSAPGFLCEGHAVADAEDITALGGWRAFLAREGD